MKFGEYIESHRLKVKKSAWLIAKDAGCSLTQLRNIERGKAGCSLKTAVRILRALNIDAIYLKDVQGE